MRTIPCKIKDRPVQIHVADEEEDLDAFAVWVKRHRDFAFDTEGTGVDIFSPCFRLRLAQYGADGTAWVIPVEKGGKFRWYARRALEAAKSLVCHNASFDLLAADRHLLAALEDTWPKVLDTRILSHLADPRGKTEGGSGHGLQELTAKWICPDLAAGVKGSMKQIARELKTTVTHVWREVPLEHDGYCLYAGMDTLLTAALAGRLNGQVPGCARPLVPYEHRLAFVCALMERRGFLVDEDYTRELHTRLYDEEAAHAARAAELGAANVNSGAQIAARLAELDIEIPETTPTGKAKVDKRLLDKLAADGLELAAEILAARKARKWRSTWAARFLAEMDEYGRCHPRINTLQARTARMSVTGIPAQTLPAGDSMVRSCFTAEDGHVIASIDYQAMELRVLAALSGDARMAQAFAGGEDLHLLTAQAAFGQEKGKELRKAGKMANFLTVYGGGAKTLSRQSGLDIESAGRIVAGMRKAYPRMTAWSESLAQRARRNGFIVTPSGRRLPVDAGKAYAAVNYMIQSTSRDVLGRALIRLHNAGFTGYLRLPVHDEVIASVPQEAGEQTAKEMGELMAMTMGGVEIATDAQTGGRSWGSLYE